MAIRKSIVSVAGQEVKVKNTFLDDVLEDSSPETAPGVMERATCPVFTRREINSFANSFEAPPELLEPIRAPWPSEMTTMDSFNQPNACADRMSWSSIASGYEPDMPIKVVSRDVPPAPLALSKPQMKGVLAPPNIGSQRHGRGGSCTPCPFFWKPSGCIEGRACQFCHLCPEIKEMAVRSVGAASNETKVLEPGAEGYAKYVGDAAGGSTAPEQHQKVLETQQKMFPTIFEDHAAGTCKPCTFFWKPEGCRKSEACHHCHLCPPSALKDRKLQKVMARRHDKTTGKSVKTEAKAAEPMPAGLIYL